MRKLAPFNELSLLRQAEIVFRAIAGRLQGVPLHWESAEHPREADFDAYVTFAGNRFAVECKWASDSASVIGAIGRLTRASDPESSERPLLCVMRMGPAGQQICDDAGVSWFDLSGNAHILGKDLYVHVEGRKNQYRRPGRTAGFFAPKASRVARWLLIEHPKPVTHRVLVQRSELGKGFVSRILSNMVNAGMLSEPTPHSFRVLDPSHLLTAWGEVYDFDKHERLAGVIQPAKGVANLRRVLETLRDDGVRSAATGLSAAWLLRRHADFRLNTVYVDRQPSADALQRLGFREEARGANLWIVLPSDAGVFHGSAPVEDVECVHPVQVLLDLARHPERAPEAADELRKGLLEQWRGA